jgi:lysophospholipase L1-like esterase
MLGTNDLKSWFALTAWDIAFGAASLVNVINNPSKPLYGGAPKILLVAPPPLGKLNLLADHYAGGAEKSLFFAKNFQKAAENFSSAFLDCSQIVSSSDEDGVHFNEDQSRPLSMAMATKALALLG